MTKLVLLRHGQSQWNLENRFTGWVDVDLTEQGIAEAKLAGQLLQEAGFKFDIAYTSVLKRANKTLTFALEELGQTDIPVEKDWRLNERHYGALQGLNKSEMAEKFGEEQVLVWRRSYDTPPPEMSRDDEGYAGNDPLYSDLSEEEIPLTECLKDTVARVIPYWEQEIVLQIKAGKQVIIVAHGNSLRALVKHLDNISDEEIVKVNIPTGVPLVYELDENLKAIKSEYLGDQEKIKAAMHAVASQGKK